MKHQHLSIAAAVILSLFPAAARPNVAFTGSYTQNFNGMALGTTTPADWFVGGLAGTDGAVDTSGNGAITGTTVQVDTGSVPAGSGTIGNYNYGPSGNTGTRCLGSIATTARGNRAMEVRINNNTGAAIGAFDLHYDGKQWRLESGSGDQLLAMKYSTDGVNFVSMGAPFDFHAIQITGTSGAIDGETIRLNRLGGTYMPASPIPNGGTFYLRWFDFNDAGVADHGLAIDNFTLSNPQPSATTVLSFVDGVNGYTGTVDTYLQQINPNTDFSTTTPIKWDGEDGGGFDYVLMRFDNIFGTGAGQIKPTDTVTSAILTYMVDGNASSNASAIGNDATVNEVAVDWTPSVTFNTFGGEPDVQADEYGAAVGTASGDSFGQMSVDVTSSITAWKSNPTANRGWIFRPGGTDGTQISSRENANIAVRPRLTVLINGGAPPQKTLVVNHEPYLQLGDAPLVSTGPGIGTTDQMAIAWQTIEAGTGIAANDYFEAEYRPAGSGSYIPVAPVSTLNTGVETRVNRSVAITGLNYDSDYEYHVFHKRNPSTPVLVTTYNGSFHTRKHPSSLDSFSFATYGDSADWHTASSQAQFESVAARITLLQSVFVVLLGDNIYPDGSHSDLDARLSGTYAPNNMAYLRNHIEYWCNGNHDATTSAAQPSLDDYYCPVPVLNVTSPVALPVGETAEKNYSFDYGLVHFTIIDSTAWGGPGNTAARQTAIVNWMAADLAARAQPWKIVAAHHPPKSYFSHTDTGDGMGCDVFPPMIANGADLLLVGHSHDYQRSFPITGHSGVPGCTGGDVTYVPDSSGAYIKGAQTIQVIAGTGGESIDGPAPTSATQWLAKAFGNNNGGVNGPFIIDVTPTQLTCKYTSAVDGSIKDQFTINIPGPTIGLSPVSLSRTVFFGDSLSNSTFSVRNTGIGSITYSISDDAGWLSVSPDSGTSSGEPHDIDVIYDISGLGIGTHNATITVSAPEAINSPRTLPVSVIVQTVKPDFDSDGDVDQSDFAFLQSCFTGVVNAVAGDCTRADITPIADGHVDANDLAVFLNCELGSDIRPPNNCAG